MKYLITGVAGFVGSCLARSILANNSQAEIVGIDNLSYGYRERLLDIQDRMEFIEGELQDIKSLLDNRKFDAIIHCAAIAPLPECQIDSYRAINQNVAICGSIVDYALASGTRDIVFFSSGAIYESTTVFPTPENTEINTRLTYPTTKYIAEIYLEATCKAHNINVTSIRLFNLYGPHQDYFRKQPPLVGYLLSSLIRDEEAILFSTGDQQRDYIYIDDLLDLVLLSAKKMNDRSEGGHYLAINAGSGIPISVNGIIERLETISGKKLTLQRLPATKYWDKYQELFENPISIKREIIESEVNKHTQSDMRKVTQEFNWKPKVTLEQGLKECWDYANQII